ncbi:signal peptidase II [Merismopedia glauca]|nr:signal peptidase II [Merismopedia glauca]
MKSKNYLLWLAAILSLITDRLTKYWIVKTIPFKASWVFIPGLFNLTYVRNKGAAWSLFSDNGSWLRWLSLAVSLGLVAFALWGPVLKRWEQAGWGLILGGAIGNGIDRFIDGSVVDFIEFRLFEFPVFNIADTSINIGIICLLIASFRQPKPRKS